MLERLSRHEYALGGGRAGAEERCHDGGDKRRPVTSPGASQASSLGVVSERHESPRFVDEPIRRKSFDTVRLSSLAGVDAIISSCYPVRPNQDGLASESSR